MSILVAEQQFEDASRFYKDLGFTFFSRTFFRFPGNREAYRLELDRVGLGINVQQLFTIQVPDTQLITNVCERYHIQFDDEKSQFTDMYGITWVLVESSIISTVLEWRHVATDNLLHSHRSFIHNGKLHFVYGSNFIFDFTDSVSTFDLSTYASKQIEMFNQDQPTARSQHCCHIYGNKMFFFGGFDLEYKFCNDLWTFDLESHQWQVHQTKNRPKPRRYHSSTVIGKKMYIFGGEHRLDDHMNDLWCLDLEKIQWEVVDCRGDVPPPRRYSTLNTFGNRMYLFAGRDDLVRFNDFWEFDPSQSRWKQIFPFGDSILPRSGHTSILYRNSLFICGGNDGATPLMFELWEFNILSNICRKLVTSGFLLVGRYWHVAVLHEDTMFIHGGKDDVDEFVEITKIRLPYPEKKSIFGMNSFNDVVVFASS